MYEPCKHNCQCPIGVSCDDGKCGGSRPPPAPPAPAPTPKPPTPPPAPPAPGAPGAPCPSWSDDNCDNESCGHDGSSENYICCKPTDNYPSGSYCQPYSVFGQAWCLVNMGEPCKYDCQCPTGVSCNGGICKH